VIPEFDLSKKGLSKNRGKSAHGWMLHFAFKLIFGEKKPLEFDTFPK
jgi:hypothetical protein